MAIRKTIFGTFKEYKNNLIIGGISQETPSGNNKVINNISDLTSKVINLSSEEYLTSLSIRRFEVINHNLFVLISTNYMISDIIFTNSLDIIFFKTYSACKVLSSRGFAGAERLYEIDSPSAIAFRRNGYALIRNYALRYVNIPNVTNLDYENENRLLFNEISSYRNGCRFYVHPSLLTSNDGNLDSNLEHVQNNGGVIIPVYDFTKPEAILDLSFTSEDDGIVLYFTTPNSVNPIDYYQVLYDDGNFIAEINGSGANIGPIEDGKKINVVARDEYYNGSISNEIIIDTIPKYFIGNVADIIDDKVTLANKLSSFRTSVLPRNITVLNKTRFNNLEFSLNIPYTMGDGPFNSNFPNSTYFIVEDENFTLNNDEAHRQFENSTFKELYFDENTTLVGGGELGRGMVNLKKIVIKTDYIFSGLLNNNRCDLYYFPNAVPLGNNTGPEGVIQAWGNANGEIGFFNSNNLTINDGNIEGDINNFININGEAIFIENNTPPNEITDLEFIGRPDGIVEFYFTEPESLNGIYCYEIYRDREYMDTIYSSGETTDKLVWGDYVRVIPRDNFYNKSTSNEIFITFQANTFIGGVGGNSVTTKGEFITLFNNIQETNIYNFIIEQNNLSFYIDKDSYNISNNGQYNSFFNNQELTYFIDLEGKIKKLNQTFRDANNCEYLYLPGVYNSRSQIIRYMRNLKYVWLPNILNISSYAYSGNNLLRELYHPLLSSCEILPNFPSSIKHLYLDSITNDSFDESRDDFFNGLSNDCVVYLNKSLQNNLTSPNLIKLQDTYSAQIRYIDNYDKPNPPTNLSYLIDGINILFTYDSSSNLSRNEPIQEIRLYINDMERMTYEDVGQFSYNTINLELKDGDRVKITFLDYYYNESDFSNEVIFTFSANTFIGGIGDVFNTVESFANFINTPTSDVLNFEVEDGNIRCYVATDYSLSSQHFTDYPNILTYWNDIDGRCKSLKNYTFRDQPNNRFVNLPGVLDFDNHTFVGNNSLRAAFFDSLQTGRFFGLFENITEDLKMFYAPELTTDEAQFDYADNNFGGCQNLYIPKLENIGYEVINNNQFAQSPQNVNIWTNPILETINDGNEEGDLAYARTNKNANIYYTTNSDIRVPPENINDLEYQIILLENGTYEITFNFTTPNSVNPISYYEIWIGKNWDNTFVGEITNSNDSIILGEIPIDYYFTIRTIDKFYNFSSSNRVLITQLNEDINNSDLRLINKSFYDVNDVWVYLPFNQSYDEIINNYDGIGTNTNFNYSNGIFGLIFNGNDSYVQLPDEATYNTTQTIRFWFNIYSEPESFYSLYNKGSDSTNGWGVQIIFEGDAITTYIVTSNTEYKIIGSLTNFEYNILHHCVVIYDIENNNLSLYLNSQLLGQTTFSGTSPLRGTGNLFLGAKNTTETGDITNFLDGYITDFAILTRVLTEEEIIEDAAFVDESLIINNAIYLSSLNDSNNSSPSVGGGTLTYIDTIPIPGVIDRAVNLINNGSVISSGYYTPSGQQVRTYNIWVGNISSGRTVFVSMGNNDGTSNTYGEKAIIRTHDSNYVARFEINGWYMYGTTSLNDGNWHMITVTFNGSNSDGLKLYVDGVEETVTRLSNNFTVNTGNTDTLIIGYDPWAANREFNGYVDEFAIFDYLLTSDEVLNLYNQYPYYPIYCSYNFEGNSDTILLDSLGLHHGTATDVVINQSGYDESSTSYLFDQNTSKVSFFQSNEIINLNKPKFKVECYLKPTVIGSSEWSNRAFTIYKTGNSNSLVIFGFGNNNEAATFFNGTRYILSNSVEINEWYKFTFEHDNGLNRAYLNDVLIHEFNNTITSVSTYPIELSGNQNGYYYGYVSDLTIHKG